MLGTWVFVPEKCREKVLSELNVGHSGMTRMKALARSYVWWPGLDEDIERLVKTCQSCQEAKSVPPAAPLHPWIWSTRPWARIHVDFAAPFRISPTSWWWILIPNSQRSMRWLKPPPLRP